jgi:F420-dependent methylenetetrahydromethanopterin dehydrogenase
MPHPTNAREALSMRAVMIIADAPADASPDPAT